MARVRTNAQRRAALIAKIAKNARLIAMIPVPTPTTALTPPGSAIAAASATPSAPAPDSATPSAPAPDSATPSAPAHDPATPSAPTTGPATTRAPPTGLATASAPATGSATSSAPATESTTPSTSVTGPAAPDATASPAPFPSPLTVSTSPRDVTDTTPEAPLAIVTAGTEASDPLTSIAPVTAPVQQPVTSSAAASGMAVWDADDGERSPALANDVDPVDRVIDYKDARDGRLCLVIFSKGAATRGKKRKTGWVREQDMVNIDIFKHDFKTIDMWKRSGMCSLDGYLATTEGKRRRAALKSVGADNSLMACGYEAVGIALQLLGANNPVTETSIQKFRAGGLQRRPVADGYSGVRWSALLKFIDQLLVVDMPTVRANLFRGNGIGVDAIARLQLTTGVYLLGGYSKERIGHAVVMDVSTTCVRILDQEGVHDVSWLRGWLRCISYIRQVQLRNASS